MYCPGQNKDLEMPLEGETRGLEVEPLPLLFKVQSPRTCQTCRLEGPPHTQLLGTAPACEFGLL